MKGTSSAILFFTAFLCCHSASAQSADAIQNDPSLEAYRNQRVRDHLSRSISNVHHLHSPAIAQWLLSQLLLFALSCMICVLVYSVAPQFISGCTATLVIKPAKSLGAGVIVSSLLALTVLSTTIISAPHAIQPLIAAVNMSVCTLLYFGFVTFAGSFIKIFPQNPFRKPGSWIKNTLFGFVILFGFNMAAGLVGAGGFGIVLDLLFSIVGIGATTITLLNRSHIQ